jgi:hypothetical protein
VSAVIQRRTFDLEYNELDDGANLHANSVLRFSVLIKNEHSFEEEDALVCRERANRETAAAFMLKICVRNHFSEKF